MARKDEYTAWLQGKLNDLGYNVAVDGINGPETQAAIRDVQRAFGLKETGLADKAFNDAFKTIKAEGPAQLTGSVGSPSAPPPNVSGRMQMMPPMPRMRPPQGGPQASGMGMPPDPLIGPTGRSGLDMPPSGGLTPEMMMPQSASGPMPAPTDREMMARALMQQAGSSPASAAPGPGAGAMPPMGPPPGVPLTGPGGSPAPQYPPPPSNPFGEMLDAGLGNMMIPGYAQKRQQPLPDYSTANSPLAGVESYQPGMEQSRQMPPPMQAGMLPPEVLRQLMQQLLQMQGR